MVFLEWLVEMRRRNHSRITGEPHRRTDALLQTGLQTGLQPALQASHPSPPHANRRPLGDLLLERRLISPEQLSAALDRQQQQLQELQLDQPQHPPSNRKLLGEILIAMTGMSEQQLLDTLAVQARLMLGLETAPLDPGGSRPAEPALQPNPLTQLAAELAQAAQGEPSTIPEWIREYAQHPEFLASSRSMSAQPISAHRLQPAAGSLHEEVARLQREPLPIAAPIPAPAPSPAPSPAPAPSPSPSPNPSKSRPSKSRPSRSASSPRRSMLPGATDPLQTPFPSSRILVAIGTRTEAIKLAPVVRELDRRTAGGEGPQRVFVCVSGQQQELVEEVLHAAGVHVDLNLNLATRDQAPAELGARMLQVFSAVIQEFAPDWVMVQGDTLTSAMAALAALYAGIRVAHVEAGLRTAVPTLDARSSLDEFNRRMIGLAARMHFAPTQWARQNLLREGVSPHDILVTGNTGIDALRSHRERSSPGRETSHSEAGPVRVLVTAGLRGNALAGACEERIAALCTALLNLVQRHPGRFLILWPLDPDPRIAVLANGMLGGAPGEPEAGLHDILLAPPASHEELLEYLEKSDIVLTDSGALQDEAPSFGKPVLVLRDTTERPEGVQAGLAWLIGATSERIQRALEELGPQVAERRTLRSTSNPYGDGFASIRIADFFAGREVAEFGPPGHPTGTPHPTESQQLQPVGVS